MLESWANTIVICALGLSLGAVAGLVSRLTPTAFRDVTLTREGKGLIGYVEDVKRMTDDQQAIIRTPEARPMKIAEVALFALIIVLVLTTWLSPVNLGWWTLLISFAVGWILTELAFRLARADKLQRLRGPSFLDPFAR
jgi:hypothetical protein